MTLESLILAPAHNMSRGTKDVYFLTCIIVSSIVTLVAKDLARVPLESLRVCCPELLACNKKETQRLRFSIDLGIMRRTRDLLRPLPGSFLLPGLLPPKCFIPCSLGKICWQLADQTSIPYLCHTLSLVSLTNTTMSVVSRCAAELVFSTQ